MKNICIIILSIAFITLSSCEKFLSQTPETTVSQENFYKSQKDFEQAVVGIYSPLREIYNYAWQMSEMRSGNTYFIYDVAQRGPKPVEDLATFTVETNNASVLRNWRNNYLIISRANQVLTRIDGMTFEQSVKDNLKGQALFLRALSYFDLASNFGDVPLFLDPPGSYAETFKNRTAVGEIYQQVIADATAAIPLLPAGPGIAEVGRATAGAASALLADVYLTLGKWPEAEAALRPVLNMGYSLLPDYSDIYRPGNKGNAEILFEVNFVEATSQPMFSTFPYAFLPDLEDPSILTGVTPETRNGDGSFNIPTPDMLAAYEDPATDKRYNASLDFYTGPSPLVGVVYNNTPYIKKYQHPHALSGQTAQNWIIYRYAEVLLMMAEVLNEQQRPADALPFINQVRTRAGLPALTTTDQGQLREKIMHERHIELAFENKRWHDLVRTGKAVQVLNEFGAKVKANPGHYYYATGNAPPPNAFNVKDDFLVFPIPVTEIVINPELQQNKGY